MSGVGEDDEEQHQSLEEQREREAKMGTMPNHRHEEEEGNDEVVDVVGEDENVDIEGEEENVDIEGEEENVDMEGAEENVDIEGEEENVDVEGPEENVEVVDIDGEEENFEVVDIDGEEENVEAVNIEGEEEMEEPVDIDGDDEQIIEVVDDEQIIEVVDDEQQGEDGEEENAGVVPGKEQPYQMGQVFLGEEENDDVRVDIDDEDDEPPQSDIDDEDDEPPQSSISILQTDDPLSSASRSEKDVFHTAAATSDTHLNTATEDAASHKGPLTPPTGMPISTPSIPNTFIPPTEDTPPLAANAVADVASPTAQVETGAGAFEVTTAAGVQFISSKQDVPKSETKRVDPVIPSADADLVFENEYKGAPFDHLKQSPPPPSTDDDKTASLLVVQNSTQEISVNSTQESIVNLVTEMEDETLDLPSQREQAPSDALELNKTEQPLNEARTTFNRDQLSSETEAVAQELERKMPAEKDIEPSGSSNHDRHPNELSGLDALTSAIDIGNARDALAKLQPKLNNGGTGGEAAGGGSNSARGRLELQQEKTELEREMELYEASEREEEARLLASMRSGDQSLADSGNDRKRASESVPNEARKKRGKRAITGDDSKEEEDVCFICFDGGELVLCDRRTCPKAYHLNCIGRDVAFFEKKGAWICGWHFCAICTKAANFQCYTCPTAYCAACLVKADFYNIRQRKGLCEECWPIVQMIEKKETVNSAEGVEVDFTDQETYEGLFKDYWDELKENVSLTPEELDKDSKAARNAAFLDLMGSDGEDRIDNEDYITESGNDMDEDDEQEEEEEEDTEAVEVEKKRKRRRGKAKARLAEGDEGDTDFGSENDDDVVELGEEYADDHDDHEKPSVTPREFDGWGSKDLIEFVKYMDEDPKKPLSRVQVTKLLWTYINTQKLQDPRKKTQIVCDDRLRTIFGKKIVGQSEMFKLLQSHFAPKGRGRAGRQIRDEQVGIEEEEVGDADETSVDERLGRMKDVKDRRRRRKSEEEKFERPSVNEYAAVTPKNIGLIYLRRQLLEELLDDPEFESKVCNTFVRIRVPGMISKSEMCYRLVQVAGTRLQAEHYKAGRKVTNYVLEILNLQKREDVTVDLVSNHDFSEEECQRLRQSMKYGFIKALTVGDIEEKSKSLQEAKVNDWFETERQRLVNLRDRASEKGRKKELRECVEKLQELNSPAFRAAKLHAIPEVTADPRMDPDYESDANDDKAKEGMSNNLDKSFSTPGDKVLPAGILKGSHNDSSRDWEGTKSKQPSWGGGDSYRSKDGDRLYDSSRSSDKQSFGRPSHNYGVDNTKERGYEERGWGSEHHNNVTGDAGWMGNGRNRPTPGAQRWNEKVDLSINVDARSGRSDYRGMTDMTTPVFDTKSDWQSRRESAPPAAPSLPQTFPMSPGKVSTQATIEAAEKEKVWHYMDPTGMVQGPFAMEQLRKWNTTGYFPEDLKIWKTAQPREESILLTDGLAGRFQKERESWGSTARIGNPVVASIQEEIAQALTTSSTLPFNNNPTFKSTDGWRENGEASGWTDRGSSDVGRSASYGNAEGNLNNRNFGRDAGTGPSGSLRDTSIDMKWKAGPAGGAYDSYGRSVENSFPNRSGRADAAAKFDPANWSRSTSGRPDRDSWASTPSAPGSDGGAYSNFGGRGSLGRGSNYRDSSGKWNPEESGGRESSRASSREALRASRKEIVCRFHAKGYCKRGDNCDYWHG